MPSWSRFQTGLFNLRERLWHQADDEQVRVLHDCALFESFQEDELTALLAGATCERYLIGDVILNEGEEGDALYVILEGNVRVYTEEPGGRTLILAMLGPGDYFGEQFLMGGGARTRNANVIATDDVLVAKMTRKALLGPVAQNPDLAERVRERSIYIATHRLGLFSYFYDEICTSIQRMQGLKERQLAAGETIFAHGDKSQVMYLITKGSVRLELPEGQAVRVLSVGSVFGELGALSGMPRVSTATAASDVELAVVDPDQLSASLPELPKFTETVRRLYDVSIGGDFQLHLAELLGYTEWQHASLAGLRHESTFCRTYSVRPESGSFGSYEPGQYLIIQAHIGEDWVERPYSIAWMAPDLSEAHIIVKREKSGHFSKWLFAQNDDSVSINVSEPKGEFKLDMDADTPVIAIASGIGVAPFLAQLEALLERGQGDKTLRLLYSAGATEDFIYQQRLDELVELLPGLRVTYLESDAGQHIDRAVLLQQCLEFPSPQVYICGGEDFVDEIQALTEQIGVPKENIHGERFYKIATQIP